MQELLRIRHAFTATESSHALHDYNLLLFAGEILFLQGISGSGKSTVIRLLQGETTLTQGSFSFQGRPVMDPHAQRGFLQSQICYLDSSNQIIDSLTVMENLLVLQRNAAPFHIFSKTDLLEKAQELLNEAEIPVKANRSARRLSRLDRQKLCILKARLAGYSLMILDCTHRADFSPDDPLLGSFLKTLTARGLSFLIISDHPNALIDVADRFQIIHRGMDVRQWATAPDNRERLMPSAFEPEFLRPTSDREHALCLGITDELWNTKYSGKKVFSSIQADAPALWTQFFDFVIPQEDQYHNKELAWVPLGSEQMLLPNLDIGDNLLLTLQGRAGVGGVIPKGMKEFVLREFRKEFQIPDTVLQVDQLSTLQRKTLSIYRLLQRRPRILVLEAPLAGLSLKDAQSLLLFLDNLRTSGIRLFILAQDLKPYQALCEVTLQRGQNRELKLQDFRIEKAK